MAMMIPTGVMKSPESITIDTSLLAYPVIVLPKERSSPLSCSPTL
eukprot:CAMPEP_0115022056 /NCGR_PEP_ID=MMETSP0216-20121206/31285_1 /TAXON_ID=223996 /ORGANISM="Protocruzia adherens, Strain Boccale" /LENGTH=44 /DNA_ID= /DNA_START= /DNA_END= /DNA_ORIENTATION=